MVDYVSTNALSMLGGDDYSDIITSLADFVTLDTSQTITGNKIFNGSISIVNTNTDITTNSGSNTNTSVEGNIILTATDPAVTGLVGEIDLVADVKIGINVVGGLGASIELIDIGQCAIYAPDIVSLAANNVVAFAQNTVTIDALVVDPASFIAFSSGGYMQHIAQGAIDMQAGDLMTLSGLNTIVNGDTTNTLKVNGVDVISMNATAVTTTNPTITNVASTAFNVTDGTINHLAITPTLTTLTNATTSISDSTGTRYTQNSTATTLTNATITMRDNSLVTHFTQAPTATTLTNATITNVATTAFKVQSGGGTDKLNITPTLTLLGNNPITLAAVGALNLSGTSLNAITTGPTLIQTPTTIGNYIACVSDTLAMLGTSVFRVQNVSGTDKLSITPTLTQFNNNPITLTAIGALNATATTFINFGSTTSSAYSATTSLALSAGTTCDIDGVTSNTLSVNNVDKIKCEPTLTTITNTDVDIVGDCNATAYAVGTAATNRVLSSVQYSGYMTMVAQAIGTTTYDCNIYYTGLPNTRNPFPFQASQAVIYGNAGAFIGGGTVGIVVQHYEPSAGTVISSTTSRALATGHTIFGTTTPFTTIGTMLVGVQFRIRVLISNTAAITGVPTQQLTVVIFGQQVA